jgi:Na+/serine symporter
MAAADQEILDVIPAGICVCDASGVITGSINAPQICGGVHQELAIRTNNIGDRLGLSISTARHRSRPTQR